MKLKKIIENIKLSLTTKRSILHDLDTAVRDAENLTKALESQKESTRVARKVSSTYFECWQNTQRDLSKALAENRAIRSSQSSLNKPVNIAS